MGICFSNDKKDKVKYNKPIGYSHRQTEKYFTGNSLMDFIPISSITIKKDIHNFYNLSNYIKKGSFGSVREAIEYESGKRFAIKSISKNLYEKDKISLLKKEIELSLSLQHQYIRKCFAVYEDIDSINMVLEFTINGDLLQYINSSHMNVIEESKAVLLLSQIFDAVDFLHRNNIVHRDLKLENFLIFKEGPQIILKLIDFGFATEMKKEGLEEKLGSLPYMAPEMFNEKTYNEKVDVWACGIIMYNMLTGQQMFYGANESEVISKIMEFKEICFKKKIWNNISENAKNLLASLLANDSSERLSACEARQHIWFRDFCNHDETIRETKFQKTRLVQEIVESLGCKEDIKNEVWSLCLRFLEPSEAKYIKNHLFNSYNTEKTKDSLSLYLIKCETFIKAIIQHSQSTLLKISLESIIQIKELDIIKRMYIKMPRINYYIFFDEFEKYKAKFKNKGIWRVFQNTDISNDRNTCEQINRNIVFPNTSLKKNKLNYHNLLEGTKSQVIFDN